MALFGTKKNTKENTGVKAETAMVAKSESTGVRSLSHIIKRPRITEKASLKSESNVYAFEVAQEANKYTIRDAVKELYNVTPIKIAIVSIPAKQVIVRNKKGIKKGGKKAYVFLKKGETIEFV